MMRIIEILKRKEYEALLKRKYEILYEKMNNIEHIIIETNATNNKMEKNPSLISFLSVFEEKNLTNARDSPIRANGIRRDIVTFICDQIP